MKLLRKVSTITYNRENRVIMKNAIILNITYNIFNLRMVICIILALLKYYYNTLISADIFLDEIELQ